ncbi:MAG: GNAT family N-acetyltransferase [Pyrinomonadaceae bacterium]|nr:GNAT family N-acetyltransferase [Pyrinomonadaceae bacterium]
MQVEEVSPEDYPELIEVWEASVRATHDFLSEEDINFLKPLILDEYFDSVELRCVSDEDGEILGFVGVADDNIEMLFVSPDSHGNGIGKFLTDFAVQDLGATKVDVNEQNPKAVWFYEHFGFEVVSRSELDGQGRPFPLLHMKLASGKEN